MVIIMFAFGCSEDKPTTVTGYSSDSPLLLTMYSEDVKREDTGFNSPIAHEITNRTGVKLDVLYPVEGVSEKIDLMINSGDYPDLVMVKDTNRMVDAGAYIDLTDLIDEHGPNIKKLYGDYINRLKFSENDQAIYVLPSEPVDEVNYRPVMGFRLQHDVVEKLGYPALETLEDYENAIREYMTLYPEINGEKTLGISFVIEDWRWKITLGNSGGFATGAPDDGNWFVDPETYEASYRFLRPEEKAYYKWLNKMYHDGLIDPDSFVQDLDAYHAKIASGRVLGLIDATWNFYYAEQVLRSNGLDERMYGTYPIQLDKTTLAADYRDVGYIAGYGIGISKNCKDPVSAIKFLDFMVSDEGQILRHWGIEGLHYFYNEEGQRKIYEEEKNKKMTDVDYASETGIGVYLYPYPKWGVGKVDENGNHYDPNNKSYIIDSYTDIEKKVLEAYGVEIWPDLYPSSVELTASIWGQAWDIPIPSDSSIRDYLSQCDNIMKEGLIKAILSEPDDFDEVWRQINSDLEAAGVHEMGKEFTKLIKKRIDFWYE